MIRLLSVLALALSLFSPPAHSQTRSALTVATCGALPLWVVGAAGALTVDANGLECVSASVSASIAGFAPGGNYATLTATGSSASVALPAGAVVVFQNTGTTAVSCTLGVGSSTATASKNIIQPASWMAFTVGSNTFGACIDQTGSASNVVVLSGGSGIPTGAGGGSSSGGGGASTIADGADVAEGTTTDGACAGDATSGCTSLSRLSRIAARLTTLITTGLPVTNANSNGQATMANSSPVVIASNQASIPVAATLGAETTKNIGTVSQLPYPSGAVPYTATATGTTGATTATLAGAASVTTYICGFSIRANATAAATGNATVTGVITATLNFTQWTAPNASGLGVTEMIFSPCVPASGTNQSVAVVSAAPGTGGVVSVTAWGYKL